MAFLALCAGWTGIGFFGASAWGAVGGVSGGPGSVERSGVAGHVTTVGFAGPRSKFWDSIKHRISTVNNGRKGGDLQWSGSDRVRVCDRKEDGHLARGTVSVGGKVVLGGRALRAGQGGSCNEAKIPNYDPKKNYKLQVCLRRDDSSPDGYCNWTYTKKSPKWPDAARPTDNYCLKVWQETYQRGDQGLGPTIKCVGGVDEYCRDFVSHGNIFGLEDKCVERTKKDLAKVLKPPKGKRKPDKYFITHRPDAELPRGNAKKVDKVTEPVGPVLGWLVWSALGGCVLGFIVVGGQMAIKHRRGEFGAHATGLGWVVVACVIVGSGFAIALISLLVDPLR
ncbi:hypothetical protein [Actinomadura sp. B10D3]|uniref:hypothetical protein n=1 Tax=Actinomadura sp. B10D3 TaxID=3153557 RepID=UPI00325D202E